jgi:hypothetical protein
MTDTTHETFEEEEDDEVLDSQPESESDSETEAASRGPEEVPDILKVVQHVRSESRAVRLTEPAVFLGEPFSISEEDLKEIWDALAETENASDIVFTSDERTGEQFVHSTAFLTVPYAQLMLRRRHNDPVYLIAETVRDESRLYPRPTGLAVFECEPFNLSQEQALKAVIETGSDEAYKDIKVFEATPGTYYAYSDRYLSEVVARAQAQWVEVDQYLNS